MRGRFFNWRAIGRAALYAIAAIAIVGTAIYLAVSYTRTHPASAAEVAPADPRTRELLRCQALGLAAEDDTDCQAAWAESRRRFLTYRSTRIAPSPSSASNPSFEAE